MREIRSLRSTWRGLETGLFSKSNRASPRPYHRNGRWIDAHAEPIQQELFDLAELALGRSEIQSVIIERDENIPAPSELAAELRGLEALHVG